MEKKVIDRFYTRILSLIPAVLLFNSFSSLHAEDWQLGQFERVDGANPILIPRVESIFHCPVQDKDVHWEKERVFSPAAVVRNGKVYLIYQAEDDLGVVVGKNTSRLGLAESSDGIHFERSDEPILYPDHDEQMIHEFPGGIEEPRIVETEEGMYVMTYTQWNHQVASLAIATSFDLLHWEKHGKVFKNQERQWSKAGSIVCRLADDRLIATKINGLYWMYWGEGSIYAATSKDLLSWEPVLNEFGRPLVVLERRDGRFDSAFVVAGPPALLTEDGIVLLYNGKNSAGIAYADPNIGYKAYSVGQVLFDAQDPTKVLSRSEECFLTPERTFEMNGQDNSGIIFAEGLVHFQNRWFLYYGAADSAIGVATTQQ